MTEPTKIETMMKEHGCTGRKVTRELIDSRIVGVEYKTVDLVGQKMMFCGIAMATADPARPFVVVGKPAVCIDPANWRDAIGMEVSFDNTYQEIYRLEAYRLMTSGEGA